MKQRLLYLLLLIVALVTGSSGAWAEEVRTLVYSNDFSTTGWTANGKTDGWRVNPGTTTSNSFNSTVIGNGSGTGDMGLVSPSIPIPSGTTHVDVEMKFKMDACTSGKSSGIEFITSDVNVNNGYVSAGTPFFGINASANGNGYWEAITAGGSDIKSAINITASTYENNALNRNSTGIVVLKARFNFTKKQTTFSLSRPDNTELVESTVVAFANSNANTLDRIFLHAGKTYGGVTIDDVKVYTVSGVVESTTYTATFTEGNNLQPDVTIYCDSERQTLASNGALEEGTTYYYTAKLAGYADYNGSFTVNAANPSVNFSMTALPHYTFTVNAVDGNNNILKVLYSDANAYDGKNHDIYMPKYLTNENNLVTYSKNDDTYYAKLASSSTEATKNISYTVYTGKAHFLEGESFSWLATKETNGNYSNGKAGRGANSSNELLTVPTPGIYTLKYAVCSSNVNAVKTYKFVKGDTEIESQECNWSVNYVKTNGTKAVSDIQFYANDILSFVPEDTRIVLDYVLLERTGDVPMDKGTWAVDTVTTETGWCIGDSITITKTGGALIEDGGAQYLEFDDGGTLTLTSAKEGYGFETIKLNASMLNATASTGTLTNGVWTGNASEVTFTFAGRSIINSLTIGSSTLDELSVAATIAEFKAGAIGQERKLDLTNTDFEVILVSEGNIFIQDATGGISTKVAINGAAAGKKLSGYLTGFYAASATQLANGIQTNYTTAHTSGNNSEATAYVLNVEDAKNSDNRFRLVTLKGVAISEEEGKFYASDKTGEKILIEGALFEDLADVIADGSVLASLTGITGQDGDTDNCIMPRKADDIVSGLIWQANNLTLGDDILSLNLTSGESLKKLGELEAGDEVHIELAELSIPEVLTPMFINTASGKNIYTIYLNQSNLDEGTVSFPITKDMVKDINKHGLTIGADAKATIIYVEPGKYEAGDDDIWLSSEETLINGLTIGEAHFADVREGDVLTMESAAAGAAMTAGESEITSGEALTSAQAEALQGGALNMSIPTTGLSKVSFEKIAVRDDIFAVEDNGDGTYDSFVEGEKVTANGIIMTFGDNAEGNEYVFAEVYPDVNNFGSATEGNSFIFEPTKDGQLEITLDSENNKIFVSEDGKTMENFNGITTVNNNMISFPVEATKTYKLFTDGGDMQFFGFKFTPADPDANNIAKDIATFKLLSANPEGDTLLLKDAVVTYISGDNVFVEDASGAIDFYRTEIQFYVGQKLNGYIVGKSDIVSEKNPLPALLRTDATKYGHFKVTEKVTPEPTVIGMEDTDDLANAARFVKLEDLKFTRNAQGFRVLKDGENEILIEDRFGVFYELDDNLQSIEGIIGLNSQLTSILWPTSKEGVVIGKADTHKTIKTLDFTTATYAENPTIVLSEEQAGTAYETGNAMQQKIYVATAPAEIAGDLAFQAVSNGSGKGWWIRSDKGGMWTYNAQRSAAVLNMKAGYRVTFNTTQQADAVMTLTDATGAPDGPFVFQLSEDGTAYICYMLEDGNIGFCGNKSVGYISSIEIAAPKKAMEVAEYTVKFVDENGAAIKEAVTRKTLAGLTATLTAKDKEAITIDGVTYLYDSDNSADTEIEADGKSVIIVNFAKASSDLSYNVQENVNGKVVRETKGNDIQGVKIKVPYRRYNLDNGTLYQKGATSKEYNYSFTLNANNQVEILEYAATDKTNVIFLTEGEDIDGATVSAHANVLVRASNSASGFAGKDLEVVKLSAGTYKMTVGCFDTSKDGNTAVFNFAANGSDLFTITSAGNNLSEVSSEEFTLTEEATIVLKAGGSESKSIDYLFITSDNGSVVKGLSVELAHTASSSCAADKDTYVSTVDAEKEHVNNEAFNAAWQGAAYMQFDYYIPEGQTITSAILKFTAIGESRRERPAIVYCVNAGETLDYTAMAAGDQKVNLAGTKVADITFPHNTSGLIEVDATEALKAMVAAGQSYIIFKVTANPGGGDINGKGSEFAPTLTIATDGDATGINELKAARFEDGAVYDLSGKKVSGTLKKGIYIMNGKKIVVK